MPPVTLPTDVGQGGDMMGGLPSDQVVDSKAPKLGARPGTQLGSDQDAQRQGRAAGGTDDSQAMLDSIQPSTPTDAQAQGQAQASGTAGGGDKGAQIVAAARTMLGVPFVYGGNDPKRGVDCSSFVQNAYKMVGINVARVTYDQVNQGQPIADINQAKPGDLVFSTGDIGMRKFGHVGIYMGNGQMIVAPHTGTVVQIQSVPSNIDAIRRPW